MLLASSANLFSIGPKNNLNSFDMCITSRAIHTFLFTMHGMEWIAPTAYYAHIQRISLMFLNIILKGQLVT